MFSKKGSFLWRHFPLNASFEGLCSLWKGKKRNKRESSVRQPGSLLRTLGRIASIVLTWSLDICHPRSLGMNLQATSGPIGIFRVACAQVLLRCCFVTKLRPTLLRPCGL